jgi:tetratricopeptide (TPR) repeat protein
MTPLNQIPMGPCLRGWLGISDADYIGHENMTQSDAEFEAFSDHLVEYCQSQPFVDETDLIDVIDELVAMDLPAAAIKVADASMGVWNESNFRGQLTLGVAHMLSRQFEEAEAYFCKAQALMPEEPAPYTNIVQILLARGEIPEAKKWCLAGLEVEPENFAFWELLSEIFEEEFGPAAGAQIVALANQRSSWAGAMLASDLTQDADPAHKFNFLDPFYAKGIRDHTFLIEYTAALGMAGHYDRIPQVVWSAEQATTKGIPWQLHLHTAQAYIALNDMDAAKRFLAKAKAGSHVPQEAMQMIESIEQDPNQFVH